MYFLVFFFFFSSRRRHTRFDCDWSSDVCSSDLISGGALPAVRVELDPVKLAANGVSLDQVRTAISATNANRPLGAVEREDHYWQVTANDQARVAADYAPLVLRWSNGNAIRLQDVADVTDSVQDVRNYGVANGKPAILLQIFKQPDANRSEEHTSELQSQSNLVCRLLLE